MELFRLFGAAFFIGFTGAMMPGPLLAVTVEETRRSGAWAGPRLMVGHALLEAALVTGLAFGVLTFLNRPNVLGVIGLLGGGMMFWLSGGMLKDAGRLSLRVDTPSAGRQGMPPAAAGALVSLSNPYWTLWWVTVGSSYVVMGLRYGVGGVVVFFLGHILSDLVWYTFISVSLARSRAWISDRVYRGMVRVCATGLLFFGVWFVRLGVQQFQGGGTPP